MTGDDETGRRGPPTGHSAAIPARGMREAVPDDRVAWRRLHEVAGVEVGHHRFFPGETAFPALPGHLVNLHLGAPTRGSTRRPGGAAWEGVQPPGTVEIFAAGTATEQVIHDPSEDASVLLGVDFFRSVVTAVGQDPDRIELVDRFETRDAAIEGILRSLAWDLGMGGLGGELYVQSLATALAVHLLRMHSSLGVAAGRRVEPEPRGSLPRPALRLVLDHVEANLGGRLSLAEVAALAGCSPRHFLRQFKGATGASPHQYVIGRRVERARGLLAESGLSLAEVAAACGFAHQQHLCRHFERLVGVSPGRYRASMRR